MGVNYVKGNIVNIDLGDPPKEVQGHEQAYDRPCVIIKSFPNLKLAVILPCTSQTPPNSHYTLVKLPLGTAGLIKDSYVLCHQIRTVSFNRIQKNIGILDDKNFLKIKAVLIDMLEL